MFVAGPPVLKGIERLEVPLLACRMDARLEVVLTVVG